MVEIHSSEYGTVKIFPFYLRQVWMTPLAGAWILVSAAAILLAVSGITALYRELSLSCEAQDFPDFCRQRDDGLRAVGISKVFYVNMVSIGVLVELMPWFLVGSLIFWRKSNELFGYVFSLMVMLQGITAIDPVISQWAVFAFPQLEWLVVGIGFIGVVSLAAWYFFPDGRLVTPWLAGVAVVWILRIVGINFLPGTPLDSEAWPEPWPLVIELALVVTFMVSLLYRYKTAEDRVSRGQIKNVVLSGVFLAGMYVVQKVVFANLDTQVEIIWAQVLVAPVYYIASAVFAVTILIAILRHRLFDIHVVIRKTLVYSLLTGLLGLVYLVSVAGLQTIFTRLTGNQSVYALVISTLGVAALFNPLRRRIQDFIDRRFYRKKYDAEKALARFAMAARNETDIECLNQALIEVVQETVQPEGVSLWLKKS